MIDEAALNLFLHIKQRYARVNLPTIAHKLSKVQPKNRPYLQGEASQVLPLLSEMELILLRWIARKFDTFKEWAGKSINKRFLVTPKRQL